MPNHQNVNTRIDHLEKLSRAELRVLWEREFFEKVPATLGRDILALGLPTLGRNAAMAGSRNQSRRNSTACLQACFVTARLVRQNLPRQRSLEPAPFWCANGAEQLTM